MPGALAGLSVLWLVVARVADRTITGVMRRRHEFGPRSGDVGMAVLATPWRIVAALLPAVLSALIPSALAVSAAFLTGAVVSPASPTPLATPSLMAAALTWWVSAWWGPGGAALRRGTRGMTRVLVRRRRAHVAVLVAMGFVLLSALLMIRGGAAPDWGPFRVSA